MPNALAHYGAQGALTRMGVGDLHAAWVLMGCILPDVPWIGQRAIQALPGGWLDPYTLRLWVITEASLFFSLLLAVGLACFAHRFWQTFGALAVGALLHLLLDAAQTKWGNGVHLLAPFSWKQWNLGLFWPESAATIALTLGGLTYVVYEWKQAHGTRDLFTTPSRKRLLLAVLPFVLYLVGPLGFLDDVRASDSHSVQTLTRVEKRAGTPVAFDRVEFERMGERAILRSFAGEHLTAVGRLPAESGVVSARGRFIDRNTVRVQAFHTHQSWGRQVASYVGLLILLAFLGRTEVERIRGWTRKLTESKLGW